MLCIWLILFLPCSTWAQEEPELLQLQEVLTRLERSHGFTFNFTRETIAGYRVDAIPDTLSFTEAIQQLETQTGLKFTILDEEFVSISTPEKSTICGYLKDENTLEPIALATVEAKENTAITDANGYFSIAVSSPNDFVTIRFLGYRTASFGSAALISQNCKAIYLAPETQGLDEVLLTSYLVQGMSKLNNGAFEIDFDKFTALPGLIETDVLQATQALPGVQSINETVSNINIRGGTNDQNLILWDGIKMYQTGHFFGLISAFNPQITQRVRLQKSGTPAEYTDGVSGSIQMQTEQTITKKFEMSAGLNLIDTNVLLDIPLGTTSSLQIGGRKSLSDLIDTPTYTSYFERITQDTEVASNLGPVVNTNRDFDFYDASMRWLYQISEKDLLRVNFIYINNRLEFNENVTLEGEISSRESSVSQNSLGAGILYERNWNDKLRTTFHIYESDYKLRAINANILDSQRFLQENVVSESGLKTLADYSLSKTKTLQFGYELIETKVTNLDDVDVPLVRTLIAEVVRTHSGFGQLTLKTNNEKSRLSAGIRYNYLDKFNKSILEPRLVASHKLNSNWSLEIAGELKHQITSQVVNFQNDFLGIEKRRWQLANDGTVPVITSQQFSGGLNYNKKGWLFTLEGYYKIVDGITAQEQGFQNQFEFAKTVGSYEVIGADFLLRKRWKNLSSWLSYSFMDNQYRFQELNPMTFPSNYDIPHSITFGSTYVNKGLKLTAGLNWRSGNPTTTPVAGNEIVEGAINFDRPNSSRFADYLRVDTSALYLFEIGETQFETGVSVWNLFNQTNTIGSFYRITNENTVVENKQLALGITPNAMVRVTL